MDNALVVTSSPDGSTWNPARLNKLYASHIVAGCIHLIASGLLFAFSSTRTLDLHSIEWSVWEGPSFSIKMHDVGPIAVAMLPPVFLLLAACNHFLTVILWSRWYEATLVAGTNYLCWIEYSVSASVMNMNILICCNCLDILQIIAVAFLTATCMYFGADSSFHASRVDDPYSKTRAYVSFAAGSVPFVGNWIIIFYNFFTASGNAPLFVWFLVVVLFLLESAFGVAQLIKIARPQGADNYFASELTLIALSMSAKLSLALIEFWGTRSLLEQA